MRILHIVSYSLFSGPVPSTMVLQEEQKRLGHDVWLAVDSYRGDWNIYEEGLEDHLHEAMRLPGLALHLSAKAPLCYSLADRSNLSHAAKRWQLDVIHCHLSHDHWLLAATPLPSFCQKIRTVHAMRQMPSLSFLQYRTDGFITRHASHLSLLKSYCKNMKPQQMICVPGSLHPSYFAMTAQEHQYNQQQGSLLRLRYGVAPDERLLGFVAHMDQRGHELLLRVLYQLKACQALSCHFLWLGTGPELPRLQSLIGSLGLEKQVHLAGYVKGHTSLRQHYAAMDGVFMGKPGNDAAMRGCLEALACQKPLVLLPEPSLLAFWQKVGGFISRSFSLEAIGDCLKAWQQATPEQLQQITHQGQAYLQTYAQPQQEAASTLQFYQSL